MKVVSITTMENKMEEKSCPICGNWTHEDIGVIDDLKMEKDRLIARTGKLEIALRKVSIASCSCFTKSPDPVVHQEFCKYRIIAEALQDTN
jgi:hypothetical protein